MKWKDTVVSFWTNRSKSQRGILIGSILIVVMLLVGITYFTSNSKYIPLYNNLSLQEVGQIKTELETRKVPYELEAGGTTITVPKEQVDSVLVDLAGLGIPDSGNIDYSFFSDNASWGISDNEFNIMKLDAMQTELANLMKGIEGIENAKVMINMPKEQVFVSEAAEEASASIVLNTQPGYKFKGNQIESLYRLVSKAVPNLPPDNIVIMNQYFEYFDRGSNDSQAEDAYTYQQTVKQNIERDIQRRVQQMLGAMVGTENVIVSVTSDVDFTQENRTEELVEPVDLENMEGLPVSIESIHETYTGNPPVGGENAGTGEGDVANYPGEDDEDNNDDYNLVKETVNNEFNRIHKDIAESPYKVRDLGIQVAVDRVKDSTGEKIEYLSQQEEEAVKAGISSILSSIIGTSIDKEYGEVIPEEKTSIVFQEFNGSPTLPEGVGPGIPLWLYVTGAICLIIIILLIILLLRKRVEKEEYVEETSTTEAEMVVPEIAANQDSESVIRRKQLEKIAKEKPEEFAKLLRSWIGKD